ncbi:MAG: neutral/alkaline non-lysosomal ceramidase N-terminal domain-containing protein [Planctomycetota bacterium]
MNRSKFKIRCLLLLLVMVNVSPPLTGVGRSAKSEVTSERIFRAGSAVSNITPPLDEAIVGGWNSPPAEHVHDELYARCLVLDDGQNRMAFVVCDSLGIAREVCDAAGQIIKDKIGIATGSIMISATHTHSSVTATGANRLIRDGELSSYQKFLVARIADGVRRAVNNLEPAKVGWGSGHEATQVFNRRYFMKPGTPTPNPFGGEDKVIMNPGRGNPNILKAAGPTDPQVAFLSVQSVSGRPIALLANYSLHYVGPSAGAVISADYFGVFADRIQQLLGADRIDPPFVGIMSNGTSGDINNIAWLEKSQRRYAPYEKMREVADLVARAVYEAHKKVEFHDWVRLGAGQEELTLAVRKPTEEQLAYARKIMDKPEDAKPYHRHEKVYAGRTMQMHESPDEVSVVLQTFRVGGLCICTIPFEVFVDIGLEIKAKSPFEQTFVISHANGSYGYLPTVEQHELGGYETWLGTNRVEIQAAPKIVRTLMRMSEKLE